jgi:hypothetical protein
MKSRFFSLSSPLVVVTLFLSLVSGLVRAEGSRSLYPASYPSGNIAAGARADLDLQDNAYYVNRVKRRGFIYVYAEADEYILLGSSNIGTNSDYRGDVNVYNPQDFGLRGDETIPAAVDFSCTGGSTEPGPHYFGDNVGRISSRAEELAGPDSADLSATVTDGYTPCAYRAPSSGIYGVLFTPANDDLGPSGRVDRVRRSNDGVAAWDVAVRNSASSLQDLDGRVFTYAFIGYTGGNNRPILSTLYYVTEDGYRYRQDLSGLDPNGYALYANTFGFLDDNQPLYKTLRSDGWKVENLPAGVTTQAAEYPIFFSDIGPGGPAEAGAEKVLNALSIPLIPPSPQIRGVSFSGDLGGAVASKGAGGAFSFNTTDTVSYQIVISRDGIDFDAANPLNRMLTGIAYSGAHQVSWDGLDNNLEAFPASITPYAYRAYGRNGEVHFPIIDAENNGSSTVAGGGPQITRLNGASPGDTTVFFDDRGYVTSSGELVGVLNGTLCDAAIPGTYDPPLAANPAVNLNGVDSSTSYRRWENGSNRNRDCDEGAGWGDAKGVNLWAYFLTPEETATLEVREFAVDVGTSISLPETAEPGATVQGNFSFVNFGTNPAAVSYAMVLPGGLTGVSFSNLPGSASYDVGSGVVTFSGFPPTLAPGAVLSGLGFSYIAPASGTVTATTEITTDLADERPSNNIATDSIGVGDVDVETLITGVTPATVVGSPVNGSVLFANSGTQDAYGVSYSISVGEPGNTPTDLLFPDLPNGVAASYDVGTGVVTLTGMPSTLLYGEVLSLSFSYTALAGNPVDIIAGIDTTSLDAISENNDAQASTIALRPSQGVLPPSQGALPPSSGTGASSAAPQAVPVLPWYWLLSMMAMLVLVANPRLKGGHQAR